MLHGGGDVSLAFVAALASSNAETQEELANRLVDSSRENLARVILSIAQGNENREDESFPRVSQQTIAEMIGVTRQRVNVLMKAFKGQGARA
jgi:CRP-like cAMP-binding protein